MAIAYESDGGGVFCVANNNNAITVPLPATRPVGSVLLLAAFCRLITAAAPTITGYTLLGTWTSATASGGRIWLYGRIVTGSETAPSVTPVGATGTSGDIFGAGIVCYSGVDTSGGITAIFDGTPTTTDASGTTTCTYPALTITRADSMIMRMLARFQDLAVTFTPTATWNERADLSSLNRTGGQFHMQDKLATASGAQASVTVVPSSTVATRYLAISLALKAPVVLPPKQTGTDQISLANVPVPATRMGHKLGVRARTTALAGTMRLQLFEGSTARSAVLETAALSTTLADYTLSIADVDAAAITDYSNLSIKFYGYAAGGTATIFEVEKLWFEAPATAAAAQTLYGATSMGVTFGKAVAGRRKTFGQIARPITFAASTVGDIQTPTQGYSAEVLADNPISYWRLGNNVTIHDEMGVSADVVAAGGWTDVGLLTGDSDTSILFDGSDDAIEIPNIAAHTIYNGSLEIWMKTIEFNVGGSYRALLCKTEAFGIFMYDNQLMTYDWGGGGNQLTGVFLNDNVRHHVVLTFQSGVAGGSRFYVDGVAVGSPFQITVLDPAEPLTIAKNSNSQYFRGNLDEAAIYGTVLSPAQIAAHYQAGITGGAPEPTTYYGAISAQYTFSKDINAIRKTFGQIARSVTFGATTSGRRKTFGQIVFPIIFTKEAVGLRKVFGQLSMQTLFGKETAGQRKTFGQVARPTTFGATIAGRRKTFGQVALPLTFGKEVMGRLKAFGQVSLPLIFSKETQGQRKTFGQLLSPFIFGKNVVASKQTFGQIALPITTTISTAGVRMGLRLYGSLSLPMTFSKDVRGQRKAFGQIVMPLTFAKNVVGQRKTFGQIIFPIIFTKEAVGRKNVFGQLTMQTLFGKEIAGRRRTFSQLALPITFAKDLRGQRKTFGRVALPINTTIVVSGKVIHNLFGSIAMPLTFGKQVAARRQTFGQITAPLLFGSASQAQRRTFSQLVLPLDFAAVIKSGPVGVHGALRLDLILTTSIDGDIKIFGVILNEADMVYLGAEPAEAVYVGIERVWLPN